MTVGNLIRLNKLACRVYGFRTNVGLIVEVVDSNAHYPPDYEILIDGRKVLVGYAIVDSVEVLNASR